MKNFLYILIISFLLFSCARVGSPVGGAKDTLAPKFLSANIDSPRIKVSTQLKELRLNFDEYVNLKNVQKQLTISPPIKNIKKIIPSNLANKYILIQWGDTLQANTTYNFNFGNAIVDNNEGNPLPYFNFAFSTGSHLDSLYISGTASIVMPNELSSQQNNIVIGLYHAKDSINFRQKPYYITKADADGYFELDYLAKGPYKLIAFNDKNENAIYDAGEEALGFIKDPISLDKSLSETNIMLYPAQKKVEYKEIKATDGGLIMLFQGQPKSVKVEEVSHLITDYQVTHTPFSDSVRIWLNPKQESLTPDKSQLLKLSYATDNKKDTVQIFYKHNTKNLSLKNNHGGLIAPDTPLKISSNYALNKIDTSNWQLRADSTEYNIPFEAKISENTPFNIEINASFEPEKKYRLIVPKNTVESFYMKNSESYAFDFSIDTPQNYGSVLMRLSTTPRKPFWIQLLNTQNNIIRTKKITDNETNIKFSELNAGTYSIRILVDNNENGRWDTADLSTNTPAEDYYLFPKKLEVRQLWDLVEDWELMP